MSNHRSNRRVAVRPRREAPLVSGLTTVLALLLLSAASMLPGAIVAAAREPAPPGQADDPTPPLQPVKLIFIHHSTGGNWLAEPSENELGGGLGRALMENNYFVSATNYGWGPHSIGDATDIPNWLDWFRGEHSAAILAALYNESGQNIGDFGSWPRIPTDPGGENAIVLFKSCFPNSDLEGRPDDPPDPEGWLSVGHAKYVYNEILRYFATRPDKLFIVITAPPLSASNTSRQAAENARAFNNWLAHDWLAENNYTLPNVGVFDFYNVLTGPDNHHRWNGTRIEHTYAAGMNTLYYPSYDDHPSRAGNEKATQEFVPLLNIYYRRWVEGGVYEPPALQTAEPAAPATMPPSRTMAEAPGSRLLLDFDGQTPPFLEAYWDESTPTRITCQPSSDEAHSPPSSMRVDFDVVPGSWATCTVSFDVPQDWTQSRALVFSLHAGEADIPYSVMLFAGTGEAQETYVSYRETTKEDADGWAMHAIAWEEFRRAEWEEGAGAAFDPSTLVLGLAFGLNGLEGSNNVGTIWVDDLSLSPEEAEQAIPRRALPCLGGFVFPLLLVGYAARGRRGVRSCATLSVVLVALLVACNFPARPGESPGSPPVSPQPAGTADESSGGFANEVPGDVVDPDDVEYLGAFRLPQGGERPRTFEYGGNAMTFNPSGDAGGPEDGFPGSLFITGHDRMPYGDLPDGGQVAEVSIPAPIVSDSVEALNRAEFVQEFRSVLSGRFARMEEIPRIGLLFLDAPASGAVIHVTYGQHLEPEPPAPTHGWFRPDLARPDFQGEWFLEGASFYNTTDYMLEIPVGWAGEYLQGAVVGTGRFRDGGWSGMGPALFAYRPWDENGDPYPAGARIRAVPLLLYGASSESDRYEGCLTGYQHPDEWNGGAWLTTPSGRTALLFAGTKATGEKSWYGYVNPDGPGFPCVDEEIIDFLTCRLADGSPCPPDDFRECAGHSDYRGWWTTRWDAQFILYDPAELARVARGELASWETQPYASIDIDEHLFHNRADVETDLLGEGPQRRYRLGDVAYDRARGLLYVLELFADGAAPVVHVWRIR